MVTSKTVAIAACGFTITEKEKLYINFTAPISTQTYTFIAARPKELSRALLFMSPFTKDVNTFLPYVLFHIQHKYMSLFLQTWLCLSICIVLMGPILYYIHHFSPVYEYKGISMKGGLSSVQNCIWYMYGALLQQGRFRLVGIIRFLSEFIIKGI